MAWPVYITIGNIDKSLRRKPSSGAAVLLGYLPYTKLECFSANHRSAAKHQLFHDAMELILKPLEKAGLDGVDLACADGFIRHVFPILASYIADYPEQCLVGCHKENSCPNCTVTPGERGDDVYNEPREASTTLNALSEKSIGNDRETFDSLNLRPIKPFWRNLPHCDIHECITPDIHHQLHKGVFHDHLVNWCTHTLGTNEDTRNSEIDARFRALPPHSNLRHFSEGISTTSQWTGKEFKSMEKVFVGVLAGTSNPDVVEATRHVLDFIHYAQLEVHTTETLDLMDKSWAAFHEKKDIFVDLGVRADFNINKLHNVRHYTQHIRSRGTADGFNTEGTERLHIDLAKLAYRASSRHAYVKQMARWLMRQESLRRFQQYLRWAIPEYQESDGDEDADVNEAGPFDEVEDDEGAEQEQGQHGDEHEDLNEDAADGTLDATTTVSVARHPAFPSLTVKSIENDFQAKYFVWYAQAFMVSQDKDWTPRQSLVSPDDLPVSVYRSATIQLPSLPQRENEPTRNVVHACKELPAQFLATGHQKAKEARFDTVLVRLEASRTRPGQTEELAGALSVVFSSLSSS